MRDEPKERQSIEVEQLIASENWVARDHMETLLNRAKRERERGKKKEKGGWMYDVPNY